jgi:hypothetical protein
MILASVMAGVLAFQINRWVPAFAASYAQVLAQQSGTKILFQKAYFRFPNHLIVKDIAVFASRQKGMIAKTPEMVLSFSWPFFSPKPHLRTIVIKNLGIHSHLTRNYWMHSEPLTLKISLDLVKGRFDVKGKGADSDKFDLWGRYDDSAVDWRGFIFYKNLYILDIDGHLETGAKDIVLKRLSFTVNGDGVGMEGHCSKTALFACEADVAVDHKNQAIGTHLNAQNTPQGIYLNGTLDWPSARVDFTHLKIMLLNGNAIKLIGDSALFSTSKNRALSPIKIAFGDFLANIDFHDRGHAAVTLSAGVFNGRLQSRIFLDTTGDPWAVKLQGSFDGVTINPLDTPYPRWLAQNLRMPSLQHLSQVDMSGRFKIDGQSKMLDDLKLHADDFDLSGFFHLGADNLISSRGAVRFSKKLLGENPVGAHILGLVKGAWTLPFEFRLSGQAPHVNVEWEKSTLKDKVRRHLLAIFAHAIDRRMDAHPYYNVTMPTESVSPG